VIVTRPELMVVLGCGKDRSGRFKPDQEESLRRGKKSRRVMEMFHQPKRIGVPQAVTSTLDTRVGSA